MSAAASCPCFAQAGSQQLLDVLVRAASIECGRIVLNVCVGSSEPGSSSGEHRGACRVKLQMPLSIPVICLSRHLLISTQKQTVCAAELNIDECHQPLPQTTTLVSAQVPRQQIRSPGCIPCTLQRVQLNHAHQVARKNMKALKSSCGLATAFKKPPDTQPGALHDPHSLCPPVHSKVFLAAGRSCLCIFNHIQ